MPSVAFDVYAASASGDDIRADNPAARKGPLAAVVVEKSARTTCAINDGYGEVQLQLDRNVDSVANLAPYDTVRVTNFDGSIEGFFKYMKNSNDESTATKYVLNLLPWKEEMQSVDFEANYSPNPDEDGQTPLGSSLFSRPINDAIPRTKHCYLGLIQDDGADYDMTFRKRNGRVIDAPNRAIDFGGPDWWWFCYSDGKVDVRHGARNTVDIYQTNNRATNQVIWRKPSRDSTQGFNVQRVLGGSFNQTQTDPVTGLTFIVAVPLEGVFEQTTGPFGTDTIGRRVAQTWRDPGILDTNGCNKTAQTLVQRHLAPAYQVIVRLLPGAPLVLPGDQVNLHYRDGSSDLGLWCKQRVRELWTGVVELTLCSAIDYRERPFRARSSAITSLISGAIIPSPIGSVGSTGGGGCCGGEVLMGEVTGIADQTNANPIVTIPVTVDTPNTRLRVVANVDLLDTGGTGGTLAVHNPGSTPNDRQRQYGGGAGGLGWLNFVIEAPATDIVPEGTYDITFSVNYGAGPPTPAWQVNYQILVYLVTSG